MLISCVTAGAALNCYDCHGTRSDSDIRPLDAPPDKPYRNFSTSAFPGNHRTHMGSGAVAATCSKCHPGSRDYSASHSKYSDFKIKLSSRINGSSPSVITPYSNLTGAFLQGAYNRYTSAWPQSATPNLRSCSNVNCHFEKDTPAWGGQILDRQSINNCSICHGAPPPDRSHPKHFNALSSASGRTVVTVCANCHANHASEAYPFGHATSAGKRPLHLRFKTFPNTTGAYAGGSAAYPDYLPSMNPARTGTCSGLYCHSNGAPFDKANVKATPTWGGSTTCASCHDGPGGSTGLSGRHGKHTATVTYGFACERCHFDTAIGSNAIKNKSLHVNGQKELFFTQGGYSSATRRCSNIYCHSNAMGNPPTTAVKWSDTNNAMRCDSCHRYQGGEFLNMTSNGHSKLVNYSWIRKYPCTYCHAATIAAVTPVPGKPPVDAANGGILFGRYVNGHYSSSRHVNGTKDVRIDPFWKIDGDRKSYPPPSYNPITKVCDNIYCHSDGTTDPDKIKDFPWDWRDEQGLKKFADCSDCHGHRRGDNCTVNCHDGKTKYVIDNVSTVLSLQTGWVPGEEWKSAMPMFPNEGVGKPRANSHPRHMQTDFSCDECHYDTITPVSGTCKNCHNGANTTMDGASHINPAYHVNKVKDVRFKQGGTYNRSPKSCSGTKCHTGDDPVWGGSANNAIICLTCHGTYSSPDTDDYGKVNGIKTQINLNEWSETGHGRTTAKGNYKSGNPPASFPGNPCWYCHDNKVMHNLSSVNPFRLKMHPQFVNRFEHECVFCHMVRTDAECLSCHNASESLAPQLANITSSHTATAKWPDGTAVTRPDHRTMQATPCMTNDCHFVDPATPGNDLKIHNNGSTTWTVEQKEDVKNQYMMMGVCLQCHDDDTNGKCTGCHTAPPDNPKKYDLGYNPGTGYIKPAKARASSVHFGHKHYGDFLADNTGWNKDANGKNKGVWKGGKFCWDCHDPHGDSNIYMIHDQVATETDGKFGIPKPGKRAPVVFTQKVTGEDYAKSTGTINGICNVCHATGSQHYRADGGDGHNSSYVCTKCHEHRFTDSHADGNACNACHKSKPVPRHSGFGLPVDCVKCHTGNVGGRVDIIGQFKGQSHHVQGVQINNKHCYQCHWESTPEGLINNQYHEGFNFKNYSTKKDRKVDLVVYGPGVRPTAYRPYSTSTGRATVTQFLAANIGSANIYTERKESANVTNHCLSCHSDQNNDAKPFNDCKTPRQYAWDLQSIAARYSQKGVTKWGKYSSTSVNAKYRVTKALSAHGNAAANQGGWDPASGTDVNISNTRNGYSNMSSARRNVQCFDCHNSHGSKAGGVTSSYVSYSGLKNGANLKEVTSGKGGYKVNYFAKPKANGSGVVNPYNAGAGQCFDCHMNAMKAADGATGTPWGYNYTFGATQPIKGYRDGYKFGDRNYNDPYAGQVYKLATAFKQEKTIAGGHLKAATQLKYSTSRQNRIDGLCTPCHDPHGVSPSLGGKQQYAVPLLKDTWLSSPYKEDYPPPNPSGANAQGNAWGTANHARLVPSIDPPAYYKLDRNTLGTVDGTLKGVSKKITQDETEFAGLCTRCHNKERLFGNYAFGSATSANNAPWKSTKRIHASVKGWGTNKEHNFTCSKCHQPHNSALPRLMQTNCIDYQHRGNATGGGTAWSSLKALTNIGATGWRDSGCSTSKSQLRGYPSASVLNVGGWNTPDASVNCHISRFASGPEMVPAIRDFKPMGPVSPLPAQWPDQNFWNSVTPWPLSK